jgi:hypothetical protein
VQHDVVICEKCFLHGLLFGLFVYTVQGPCSSATPSQSEHASRADGGGVEVGEADGPFLGGVKRDLVVIVFVMHMDGRHQMWVLHGVYDRGWLDLNGSGPVRARHKSVRRRCPSVLPSLRRWLAPSFTHPSIDFLAILLHARIACPDCCCLVKSVSQPRRLAARALSNINKAAPSASSPPIHTRRAVAYLCLHLRSPPRLFPRPTSLIYHQYSTPALAVPSASTLVSSIQQLSSCRRTPDCRVARRICRIRPLHALSQQAWSVLMAT